MKILFYGLVTFLLSAGDFLCQAANVNVPDVVNQTQSAAENALTAAGLTTGNITTSPSNAIVSGNVISENPAAGTSVASGSAVDLVVSIGSPQFLPSGQNNAVSDLISAQNGTLGSLTLPAGQNEAVSKIVSAQNGTLGSLILPAGQNEAVSKIVSAQNGTLGSLILPAGENEAVSKIISAQNGTIGSQSLPAGFNEGVSDLIAAAMNEPSSSQALLKAGSASLASSGLGNTGKSESLNGVVLMAGDTITVASDIPAQISLNGVRAGNDPGSSTDLTFVVPENVNSLRVRTGLSADSAVAIQAQTRMLTGLVVDGRNAPAQNAQVHLLHQGLTAEFYRLPATASRDEFPSLVGLKPFAEEPVSSLNLHDPNQALGYFAIGGVSAPDFAVRLTGELLASTGGSYSFYLAATEKAQLSIDGIAQPVVSDALEGLERAIPIQLSKGWHKLELLASANSGSVEAILSFAPPSGPKQLIDAGLLRSDSTVLSAITGADGRFSISVPGWLKQVRAVAQTATGNLSATSVALAQGASAFEPLVLQSGPSL